MDPILLALGLYGFSGSILLVIFHFYPYWKEERNPKKIPFFRGEGEETNKAHRIYRFYSKLWSFRLISTGFLIMILQAIHVFEIPTYSWSDVIFILFDVGLLVFVALCIDNVSYFAIQPKHPFAIFFYRGISHEYEEKIPFPFLAFLFYGIIIFTMYGIFKSWPNMIFIIATFSSAEIFSILWARGAKYLFEKPKF